MSKIRGILSREGVRRAFTLLELLIVILLLSIFTLLITLSLSKSGKRGEKGEQITPARLKKIAPGSFYPWAELVCIDECRQCFFHTPQGTMNAAPYTLPPLKAYSLNGYLEPVRLEFGRYQDQPVCLRFRYFPNGSNDQMILQKGEMFYFVPSFFGKVENFNSLEEARDYWLRNRDRLRDIGDIF